MYQFRSTVMDNIYDMYIQGYRLILICTHIECNSYTYAKRVMYEDINKFMFLYLIHPYTYLKYTFMYTLGILFYIEKK